MARVSRAKAKEKKQKIVLGVAAVLLLGLLVIQGPKFMKLLNGPGSSSAPAPTTTTTSTTPASPASAPSGGRVSGAPDKLASLTLFRAKDPFVQLVPDGTSSPTPAASAPPPPPKPAPAPKPRPAPKPSPAIFGIVGASTSSATSKNGGALPTARILLNGAPMSVALGHAFPASKPVFRLAGVQASSAMVALVTGALANGTSLLELRKGRSVTLMNTVDHHRYTLKLLASAGV